MKKLNLRALMIAVLFPFQVIPSTQAEKIALTAYRVGGVVLASTAIAADVSSSIKAFDADNRFHEENGYYLGYESNRLMQKHPKSKNALELLTDAPLSAAANIIFLGSSYFVPFVSYAGSSYKMAIARQNYKNAKEIEGKLKSQEGK